MMVRVHPYPWVCSVEVNTRLQTKMQFDKNANSKYIKGKTSVYDNVGSSPTPPTQ